MWWLHGGFSNSDKVELLSINYTEHGNIKVHWIKYKIPKTICCGKCYSRLIQLLSKLQKTIFKLIRLSIFKVTLSEFWIIGRNVSHLSCGDWANWTVQREGEDRKPNVLDHNYDDLRPVLPLILTTARDGTDQLQGCVATRASKTPRV